MPAPTLSSRVSAVTVFRRGAQITRTAILERGADGFPDAVRLEGLPLLLQDSTLSVQLHPEGEGQAPLAGDLRVTLAVPERDPELRPPTNAELDEARVTLARAQQLQADLEATIGWVAELRPGARGVPEEGQPPMGSPTDARLALLDFRRARLRGMDERLALAVERTRLAKEALATLVERERRASAARNPRTFEARKAVVVGLRPAGEHPAARLRLELRYFVQGARWAPSYVLRLHPSLEGGTLELQALVGQATGERWSQVALTLSTAHPQQWHELPELRSMRIGRRQPPPPRTGWRPPPTGTDALYGDFDRDLPPPPQPRPVPKPSAAPPPPPPAPAPAAPPASLAMHAAAAAEIAAEASSMFSLEAESAPRRAAKKMRVRSSPPPGLAPAASGRAGGAPPAPQAARAPVPMQFRDGGGVALAGFGSSGGGGPLGDMLADDAPASVAATLTADKDLLEYGSLRLPGPEQRHRGTLRRADQAERYGQLADLPAEAVATALARAQVAAQRAAALEGRSAPAGHRWAEGSDGFDYAYPAQGAVDLDSDGQLHGLPLSDPSVEATARYVSVPRETQDVFRVLVVRNPLEAPLLPGPVDVYVDGRFLMATALELTPSRGRVELGLGVEQGIKIARNVRFDDEASGLLRRHRELDHHVEVEIANHLAQAATVEVRERVPVVHSEQEDIEITEHTVDPAWHELTQDDPPLEGGRRWKVEVGAGARRTLKAHWSIKIPQSQELVGGNRRES